MTVKSQQQQKISFNWQYSSLPVLLSQWESSFKFLVELALAEQDSKFKMPHAWGIFPFFQQSSPNGWPWSQALLAETVETGDRIVSTFIVWK